MSEMPASPFLPGTKIQYAWDSTSLGYLKTCPRLYYYHMIEGWVPKEESIHLRFGQEYHQAIFDFEMARAAGESFEDSLAIAVLQLLKRIQEWDPDPTLKASANKNKPQLLYLVVAYCDEYRNDPCETVILESGRPAVELSFRFELDWGPLQEVGVSAQPYILCGHLDRVVTYADSVFVLDHKTATNTLTDYYFAQYDPNNQMTLYSFAGKVVMDSPVAGVMVEAVQVTIDKPMVFERRPSYRTDQGIDEWLDDLQWHLQNAEDFARSDYWPMNDTACGNYGGCKFREVCSRPQQVRERFLKADFIQLPEDERWNPLRSR
jgi:hypothetical protein